MKISWAATGLSSFFVSSHECSFRSKLITRSKEQDGDELAWELTKGKYYPMLNCSLPQKLLYLSESPDDSGVQR